MPKPNSKQELLDLSEANYRALLTLIESYDDDDLDNIFPEGMLNKNIRDVIAHLHEWHMMMLSWHEAGKKGVMPDMPAKGYTWLTTKQLNVDIREKHLDTSLTKARLLLDSSYVEVRKLIESHSDEDLFEKKKYKWTGSTSLGAYLISNTSSHYAWAIKVIKKGMRQ